MKVTNKKDKHQVAGVGVIVFSIVVVVFMISFYLLSYSGINTEGKLKGVVLDNGDLYFGRLSYFPRLTLHDAYTIQAIFDAEAPDQTGYQVVPLENSIWSPNKIFLNHDKIVFTGDVGEDSQVMQIINQQKNK